jgi:hypothetical protein
MAGALEKKRMLIKYSNVSRRIKAKRIEANNMAYTRYLMAVTPPMRKQIKRKKKRKRTIQKPGFD